MTELPEPLTPVECDLRDFPRLMIDINRLFGSTFNVKASRTPLAWMIGHKLWYKSWHQMPAASLPDDEEELCYLAELGFDLKTFRSVREIAMHGWVKCSDGRLYHPVVAEAALDAWASRQRKRYNTECGRIKKHNQRHGTSFEAPSLEDFIASGCVPLSLASPPKNNGTTPVCPVGHGELSPGTSASVPRDTDKCPPGKHLQGREKGERRERDTILEEPNGSPELVEIDPVAEAFAAYDDMRRELVAGARAIQLSPDRRKKLAARLDECGGPSGWADVLETVRGSPFLRGEASRNGAMVATIDWLLEPKNLRKVTEGNYDDRSGTPVAQRAHVCRSPIDALSIAISASGLGE